MAGHIDVTHSIHPGGHAMRGRRGTTQRKLYTSGVFPVQ
jgi:hypothetical protein